jgi:SAM-dependent methyltransferase
MMQCARSTIPLQLLRMADGLIVNRALCAAASLGIADLLRDGPRETGELAAAVQVNEQALYRVLRFLAGQGVFREAGSRQFTNSELSEWLRSDVPGSVRRIVVFRGSSFFASAVGALRDAVATGAPAHEAFERLRQNPEEAQVFDDAMTDISAIWAPFIGRCYDFGQWGSLTDLGGGNGLLLAEILRAHPKLSGVLAEQPHVLERAKACEFWDGLSDRVCFQPADFFQSVPSGSRGYLMKNVIHDWDDELALCILKNCRRAVPDGGVLLVIEYSLGAENTPSLGKTVDMVMLASTGGRERTIAEHRELLATAGFRLANIIPVEGDVIMLEAKPTVG